MECWSNVAHHSNTPSLHHSISPTPSLRSAFSLIEMIGVLAVIAILAATVLPNIIRRIDFATWQRETSDLKVMADGLVKTILTDKQILSSNNIPTTIAKYLDLSLNQVTNTPRRFNRVFLVDPSLTINGGSLPYSQGSGGSAGQTSARIMILSTIAGPAVSTITDTFSTIWNTPDGGKPATWTGKAEDLCIQRVELGGLFHKLYFLNTDTNSTYYGYYRLETNATMYAQPSGGQVSTYVLHGTALNLYAAHDPNNLQMRIIVNRDESFVYQKDQWGHGLTPDQPDLTLDPNSFGDWVSQFLNAPAPPDPKFAATQRAVVDKFYDYLWSYWSWGNQSPPFPGVNDISGPNAEPHNPYFRTAYDAQGQLDEYTGNLIN